MRRIIRNFGFVAGAFLTLAIELNPKNRIHAFHDTDFEVLREDPEYRQLFF